MPVSSIAVSLAPKRTTGTWTVDAHRVFADQTNLVPSPHLFLLFLLLFHPSHPPSSAGLPEDRTGNIFAVFLGMGPGLCDLKELHIVEPIPD